MRSILFSFLACVLLLACSAVQNENEQIGLRSDGYYEYKASNLVYLMRFSAKGNVILIGGHKDNYDGMVELLDPEIPEQNNVHNVRYVILPNDSIFFYTATPKGRIAYSGSSVHPDTLRILRKSHINGKEATLDYVFVPENE